MNLMPIKDNDIEQVVAMYKGEKQATDLPEKLQEKLQRWQAAHDWMLTHYNRRTVASMLMNRFNISQSLAYMDLNNSQKIYNFLQPWDAEYIRNMCLHLITSAIAKENAKTKPDNKAVAMLIKDLVLLNQEKSDTDIPMMELYEFKEVVITAKAEDIGIETIDNLDEVIAHYTSKKALKIKQIGGGK